MKFLIVLSCLLAVAFAKPGFLAAPLAYSAILPGAPLGLDGKVVDEPAVALAKAEHAAAHIDEHLKLNNERLRSADFIAPAALPIAAAPAAISYAAAPAAIPLATRAAYPATILSYNGIAADGRPLDTPEVALAKVAHANAHIKERLTHANEFARNAYYGYGGIGYYY